MDQFITFRSRRDFVNALRLTAEARGIPVSQLIRETLSREISYRGLTGDLAKQVNREALIVTCSSPRKARKAGTGGRGKLEHLFGRDA